MPKSLTVSYKHYDLLDQFTPAELTKLGKLSYGWDGMMFPVIEAFRRGFAKDTQDGYGCNCSDCRADRRKDSYGAPNIAKLSEPRFIVVAYVGKKPVGWCVNDLDNKFNVYVQTTYRNLGIAQKIAELWAAGNVKRLNTIKRNDQLWSICHTSEAIKLMRNAMRKLGLGKDKKIRKVTHKVVA